MPTLTIFTAPKPFTNPHIAVIQRNALRCWTQLGAEVEVIAIGDEVGLAEVCAELGILHLPNVACNANGTPLVNSIFDLARAASQSPFLAYVNADILVTPSMLEATLKVAESHAHFLLVGQRWDADITTPLAFSEGWEQHLRTQVESEGKRHRASGSDYFAFPRACFVDMPAFAIGRAGWDNWMIYAGRAKNWPVVDASDDIWIAHQNHDYSHLPGGQPHYKQPETFENIRLAGGNRVIFELSDCSHRLHDGKLIAMPRSWKRFAREAEIFPLVKLHSYPLAQFSYAVAHPQKAFWEWRRSLKK